MLLGSQDYTRKKIVRKIITLLEPTYGGRVLALNCCVWPKTKNLRVLFLLAKKTSLLWLNLVCNSNRDLFASMMQFACVKSLLPMQTTINDLRLNQTTSKRDIWQLLSWRQLKLLLSSKQVNSMDLTSNLQLEPTKRRNSGAICLWGGRCHGSNWNFARKKKEDSKTIVFVCGPQESEQLKWAAFYLAADNCLLVSSINSHVILLRVISFQASNMETCQWLWLDLGENETNEYQNDLIDRQVEQIVRIWPHNKPTRREQAPNMMPFKNKPTTEISLSLSLFFSMVHLNI